jgi:hypothetical protein
VAKLEVLKIVVEHHRQGGPRDLTQHERVDVHENDQIKVLDQGRAILDIQGIHEVELFRGAEVDLDTIRVDPDGFVFTILGHMGNHIRVAQNENMNGRLIVMTAHATVTPSDGSEIMVCHGAELTCITTMKGDVEVEAQGKVVTVKEGESTFVLKDKPPEPITCSNQAEFRQWLDQKRGTGEVEPLGALVQKWSQKPCPGDSPTPTVTPPDSEDLECNVTARRLNLRDAPSTSHGRRIGHLRFGDHFEAVARDADGMWLEGHAQSSDQKGWVFARYVSCDGSVADLPVSEGK